MNLAAAVLWCVAGAFTVVCVDVAGSPEPAVQASLWCDVVVLLGCRVAAWALDQAAHLLGAWRERPGHDPAQPWGDVDEPLYAPSATGKRLALALAEILEHGADLGFARLFAHQLGREWARGADWIRRCMAGGTYHDLARAGHLRCGCDACGGGSR